MKTENTNCAYCMGGELVDKFGIKVAELSASTVYLFREQSHRGRVIVASNRHVSELVDLPRPDRQAFLDDVARVAKALHKLFKPQKVNYGAYGDTGSHLHFHLVPKYAADEFEWGSTFAMDPKRTYLSEEGYGEIVSQLAGELCSGTGIDFRKSLAKMRDDIRRDGRMDICESAFLLRTLAPIEGDSATIAAFLRKLREVRSDGQITSEESDAMLKLLDELLA